MCHRKTQVASHCAHVFVVIAKQTSAYARMALRKPARLVVWTVPQNARLVLLDGQSTTAEQSVLVRA